MDSDRAIVTEINESPVNPLHLQETGRDGRGRFRAGQSGNPRGRPKGARGRATLLAEFLRNDETGDLRRLVVSYALDGYGLAMRYALKHLMAPRRVESPPFEPPPVETPEDAAKALAAILAAAARGDLAVAEANRLAKRVERMLDRASGDVKARLQALEHTRRRAGQAAR